MKKSIILAVIMLLPLGLMAETIPATDTRVTFVGRTAVEGTTVSFDWTATYFRVAFSGKSLTMKASDLKVGAADEAAAAKLHNYYAVWVDSPTSAEPHRIVEVKEGENIIELVDPNYLKKSRRSVHEVIVQKRTEGEQGRTTVYEFTTDGQFFQAEPLRARQLEFIGDSYTCGYGIDAPTKEEKFSPETENASRSYAAIVSRYFGADYIAVAHSGMGMVRNYNSKFAKWHMPERYLQTFDMDSTQATRWNAADHAFKPAMSIIYLGANDFSGWMMPDNKKFNKGYLHLLSEIKANYGEEHPILCMTPGPYEFLFLYVRDVVNNCGLTNVHYLGYFPAQHHNTDEDLGAGWHPNYNGQKKLAFSIIPYIATITGWGLQDVPVK